MRWRTADVDVSPPSQSPTLGAPTAEVWKTRYIWNICLRFCQVGRSAVFVDAHLQFLVWGGASSSFIRAYWAALRDNPRIPSPHSFSALRGVWGIKWRVNIEHFILKHSESDGHPLTLYIQCICRCIQKSVWQPKHSTKMRQTWGKDSGSSQEKRGSCRHLNKINGSFNGSFYNQTLTQTGPLYLNLHAGLMELISITLHLFG